MLNSGPSIIVAVDLNGAIGKGGQLPWRLPNDLKYFREVTSGHHVIMGRKTFESIGRSLPGRTNFVVSRQAGYKAVGCTIFSSLGDAIAMANTQDSEPFILGGGQIYIDALPLIKKVYLTEVNTRVEGADTYFAPLDPTQWTLKNEHSVLRDENNAFDCRMMIFERN